MLNVRPQFTELRLSCKLVNDLYNQGLLPGLEYGYNMEPVLGKIQAVVPLICYGWLIAFLLGLSY